MPISSQQSVDRRILSGTALTYLGFFAGKLIVFLNTVVLARLLVPEHFGLVAIGLLVLAVNETVAEAGIGAAVVWRPGEIESTAPVAMMIGLIGAAVAAGVAIGLAPAIAAAFEAPEVAPIIRILALATLLSTPASVFNAILQRRMAFGRRLVPEVVKALVKGAVGIPLAYHGLGAWSLVYGHLAGVATGLVLSWCLSGWKIRLSLEPEVVRQVLPYGLQIATVGLLGLAIRRLDVTIIAYRLNPTELGYYTLAFSLIELSVMGLCWSASQAFFPALSRSEGQGKQTEELFAQGLATLLAVTVPLAIGLSVLAEPLIRSLYGEKWLEAVLPMQILAFHALIFSMGFNLGDVYKARGQPSILTAINIVNLIVAVPLLLLAAQSGLVGVAFGQVGLATVITAVNWIVASRVVGIGPAILIRAARGPLLAATLAAAASLAVDYYILLQARPPIRLFLGAAMGIAVYAAAAAFLVPDLSQAIRIRLASRRSRLD